MFFGWCLRLALFQAVGIFAGGVMNVLSLSGGKDSVAAYFLCRDEVDIVVYADGGLDFPAIRETALLIGHDFASRGGCFEVVTFDFLLGLRRWGWPSFRCRWCTGLKVAAIQKFVKSLSSDVVFYQGIAFDEQHRCMPGKRYPLVDVGMTERQALSFCYSEGVDFGGIYHFFDRTGCWCCPLGGKSGFYALYRYSSHLWSALGALNDIASGSLHPALDKYRYTYESLARKFQSQLFWF